MTCEKKSKKMIIPVKIEKKYVPMEGVAVPLFRLSFLADFTIHPGDELLINPKDLENVRFVSSEDIIAQEVPHWAK